MNNFISSVPSSKPSFSAPVVQSRLEHHHLQQLLSKPQKLDTRQQQQQQQQHHQRSKSIKSKRGPSKDTPVVSVSPNDVSKASNISRSNNYSNNYNRVDSFNSSKLREPNSFNGINTCESFDNKKQRSGDRRLRRHAYSDSVDEDKFRNVAPITILKRPQSATDFVKQPTSGIVSSRKNSLNSTPERNEYSQQSLSITTTTTTTPDVKERRRSDVASSKVNRVQRRKEVKSTNDVSQSVNSTITTTTTTLNKLQPDSSIDESDVNIFNSNLKSVSDSPSKNSTGLSVTPPSPVNNSFVFPLLNYSNAIIALEEEMSNQNDKRSSDVIIPPKTMSRRTSGSAVELQKVTSAFAIDDAINEHDHLSLPSLSSSSSSPPSPSSPLNKLKSSPKLYAGPTFHNSPPASDLPIPSFLSKSSTRESSPISSNSTSVPSRVSSPSLSSENSSDEDISMDESEPYLKKQNSQLLNMLSSSHPNNSHNSAAAYMVPERMATSHNPMQVYPAPNGMLNELSECLRSLLKIHGQ
ncbi:hypothetical protein Glove_22g213 [Diversispora epigaea]|uniref:Uncharacterized protein n=1 Tax=Diversispora epigaea TaxID=1348612 RepID=A0A397JJQ7_9GLOM|nr:hypothetical protein Glove_22g213 [Diversispora epigaea]